MSLGQPFGGLKRSRALAFEGALRGECEQVVKPLLGRFFVVLGDNGRSRWAD